MRFERTLMTELPFMVNLPSGDYQVGPEDYHLDVLQSHFAVPVRLEDGRPDIRIGSADEMRNAFGNDLQHMFRFPLHTLVRHRTVIDVPEAQISVPTERDISIEWVRVLTRSGNYTKTGEELIADATEQVRQLPELERQHMTKLTAKRLTAGRIFPFQDTDLFLAALNKLIRSYITHFGDFFAEEVTLHQLSGMTINGILMAIVCDGEQIDGVSRVGKIPPVMRQPWQNHPPELVEQFRQKITAGDAPDAVELLGVRARAFLERGAYRSAVIEASAALELAVARRIRLGLGQRGLNEEAIKNKLRGQRFQDRCKALMQESSNFSLAAINPQLWQRVGEQREKYRNLIAHSDTEPAAPEAAEAVNDALALATIAKTHVA